MASAVADAAPRTEHFPAADGHTELVGYLFAPEGPGPHPAIVLLHGRGGPYSSNVSERCTVVARDRESPCNAATLSRRHRMWGDYWAGHGYVAAADHLLVYSGERFRSERRCELQQC